MKVVLLKSVDNLGTAGDAVSVKRGYFRNYLEPRRIALLATKENLTYVESQKEKLEAMVAKETQDASALKDKLEQLDLHFELRAGETGRLFGSVTAKDVMTKVEEESGIEIERRKVEMENLKDLGTHDVRVRVYPGVVAHVKVTVERLLDASELEDIRLAEEDAAAAEAAAEAKAEEVGYVEGEEASLDEQAEGDANSETEEDKAE